MARQPQLDALRGLFLLVMTVDHFHGEVSEYTAEAFGFISAASGFIFISGLVCGQAYVRHLDSGGGLLERCCRERARLLYFSHLGMLAFLLIVLPLLPPDLAAPYILLRDDPLRALALGGLFLYQPRYFDILPLYTLFVLGLPFLLRQFDRCRTGPVLLLSALLWLAAQAGHPGVWLELRFGRVAGHDLGLFNPAAWQLLFVLGAALGYRRARGRPLPACCRRLLPVSLVTATGLLLLRHGIDRSLLAGFPAGGLAKASLGWLRLLDFLALANVISHLAKVRAEWFRVRWLEFLGRHSLPVFIFHVFAALGAGTVLRAATATGWGGRMLDLELTALLVTGLFLPAGLHHLWRNRRRIRAERGLAAEAKGFGMTGR